MICNSSVEGLHLWCFINLLVDIDFFYFLYYKNENKQHIHFLCIELFLKTTSTFTELEPLTSYSKYIWQTEFSNSTYTYLCTDCD